MMESKTPLDRLADGLVMLGGIVLFIGFPILAGQVAWKDAVIHNLTADLRDYERLASQCESYVEKCEKTTDACIAAYNKTKADYDACVAARAATANHLLKSTDSVDEPELLYTAKEVAGSHPYDMLKYNCEWFTKQDVAKHKAMGYDAEAFPVQVECDSGFFENKSCAYWNGRHVIERLRNVYIEATTGEVIPPSRYWAYGLGMG